MKANILFYCILLAVFGIWLFGLYLLAGKIDLDVIGISIFGTALSILLIASVLWRVKNGVDLCANLESDPEKVKQHMLVIMQFGHTEGIVGAFKEFNQIFRNYPQWRLQDWEVFRAWYKHEHRTGSNSTHAGSTMMMRKRIITMTILRILGRQPKMDFTQVWDWVQPIII